MSMYNKIAEDILKRIQAGEWLQGQMIPSENELCEQFGVSRPTVRAALALLVNQGYLVREKGKGSFVTKPRTLEGTTIFLESFTQAMAEKGVEVATEVLEQRLVSADEQVASMLGVRSGEDVFKLTRLRFVKDSFDEGPIVYNVTYLPAKYTFLQKCDFEKESLTSALRRNGVERRHLEKNIRAVLIEGRIARILGVQEKTLGICIHSVAHLADRREVVEYTASYYPSDRNEFLLKISM